MAAQYQSLPICETKGEISAIKAEGPTELNEVTTRQMSSVEDISKMDTNQLESSRGIKRFLDETDDTPTVPELNRKHVVEATETLQRSLEDGGRPTGEDECGLSHRKKRRLISVDVLDTPEDSGKQSSAVVSSSDRLVNQIPSCKDPVHGTLITSSAEPPNSFARPPTSLIQTSSESEAAPTSGPVKYRDNSISPFEPTQSPLWYQTPSSDAFSIFCSQPYVYPVSLSLSPTASRPTFSPKTSLPEVSNQQSHSTYPTVRLTSQLYQHPLSQNPYYHYFNVAISASPHLQSSDHAPSSNSKAQSPTETPHATTVQTPLKTETSNDCSTSGQMPSKPPAVCEQSASKPLPPEQHIAVTKTNLNVPGLHEPAYIGPRNSPLSEAKPLDSIQQAIVARSAPRRRSSYDVSSTQAPPYNSSPLECQPPRHHAVSSIISHSADVILDFFDRELKLVQAKHDVQITTIQSAHQANLAAIEMEHRYQLASAKRASESEIKTLERAHWRAMEEKEAVKRDAEEKDKENGAKIETLEKEVEILQAKSLGSRRLYEKEFAKLKEGYEMRESVKDEEFWDERQEWKEQQEKWEEAKDEGFLEQQKEWAKQRRKLLEDIEEERRLRAQAEKARKALGEERKAWGQLAMKLNEQKLGLQKARATQMQELEGRFEEERKVRTNEEAAKKTLEDEKRALGERISKLEEENSEFEKAKKQLEVWVVQMKAALLQQVEDDKKRMVSANLAWQEKMKEAMQEEKIKGEKDGYKRGKKDGFEKGEKDGVERGERDGYERRKDETLQQVTKLTAALGDADKKYAMEREAWIQEKKRLEEEGEKLELTQQEAVKRLKEEAMKAAEKLDQYWAKEIETRWENLMAKEEKRWEAEKACRAAEDAEQDEKMEKRDKELQAMTKKVALLERQSRDVKIAGTNAEAHIDAMTKKIKLLEKQVEVRRKANEEDLLLGQNATALGPYSRTEAKSMLEGLVQGGAGATTAEPTTGQPCYLQ